MDRKTSVTQKKILNSESFGVLQKGYANEPKKHILEGMKACQGDVGHMPQDKAVQEEKVTLLEDLSYSKQFSNMDTCSLAQVIYI